MCCDLFFNIHSGYISIIFDISDNTNWLSSIFCLKIRTFSMATSLTIIQNFINNEYFPAKNFIASYDPAIGEVWAKVPDSDAEEVEQAYQAAKKAFSGQVKRFALE